MQNNYKKIARTVVGATASIMYALYPVSAFAVDSDASNSYTGSNSDNTVSTTVTSNTTVSNDNTANITNNLNITSNTGHNSASDNTGDGSVHSGAATSDVAVTNQANTNNTTVNASGVLTTSGSNDHTGSNSDNNIDLNHSTNVDVTNSNDLSVKNNVTQSTNTGYNRANDNTGDGSVHSGDASNELDVRTTGNRNTTTLDLMSGDPVHLSNSFTGSHSDNDIDADISMDIDIDNDNDAHVYNDIDQTSNTGHNRASDNTGDGSVDSGDAENVLGVVTSLNRNDTTVEAGGDFDATLSNMWTGSHSDNDIDLDVDNSLDIDNSNSAWVKNKLDMTADTGYNRASDNTGDGDVHTGDASNDFLVDTSANVNLVDVEETFGDIDITAFNDTTGSGSDNDVDVDLDNDWTIDNHNHAKIYSDLDIDATTGDNRSSDNTGDGDVHSGAADIFGDLLTSVNRNTVGALGGGDITFDGGNDTTGSTSDNEVNHDVDNTVDLDNDNHSHVNNYGDLDVDTGDNNGNDNTGDGGVHSGMSSVDVLVDTTQNINN
jgi:hypothetical protein